MYYIDSCIIYGIFYVLCIQMWWVVGLKLCLELDFCTYYIDSCIIHRFFYVLCIHMWWVIGLKLCLGLNSSIFHIDSCFIFRIFYVLCIHMWLVIGLKLCLELCPARICTESTYTYIPVYSYTYMYSGALALYDTSFASSFALGALSSIGYIALLAGSVEQVQYSCIWRVLYFMYIVYKILYTYAMFHPSAISLSLQALQNRIYKNVLYDIWWDLYFVCVRCRVLCMCRHPRSHRPYHFACRLCRTNSIYMYMICTGFLFFMYTVYRVFFM